jgi:hypothetical protein
MIAAEGEAAVSGVVDFAHALTAVTMTKAERSFDDI